MRQRWGWVAVITLIALAMPLGAQAETSKITARVIIINGTPEANLPQELPVTLYVLRDDHMVWHTTILAVNGHAHSDRVPVGPRDALRAELFYEGVRYTAETAAQEARNDGELAIVVHIYETTADPENIVVTQWHIWISKADHELLVGEHYLLSNYGTRTYIGQSHRSGGRRLTMAVTLPPEANDLRFGTTTRADDRYALDEGMLIDTQPIPPGQGAAQIDLSYRLPYREELRLERVIHLPLQGAVLLASDGLGIRGQGIVPQGLVNTPMGAMQAYRGAAREAGQPFILEIAPLPDTQASRPRGRTIEMAIGLLTLLWALAIAYLLWTPSTPTSALPPSWAQPIVEELAALDQAFHEGSIPQSNYDRDRAALKAQLQALCHQRGARYSSGRPAHR